MPEISFEFPKKKSHKLDDSLVEIEYPFEERD